MALSSSASPLRWAWLIPVAIVVVAFHASPFSRALDRAFHDAAVRHPLRMAPIPPGSAIVLIDEGTLGVLGHEPYNFRWPFPRVAFAGLIAALDRAGASRVVVDFTFLEQSEAVEQDILLAGISAALPKVVLAGTRKQGPVFWDSAYRRAYPRLFQGMRTGDVTFESDEDGVARRYSVPDSLAAAAFGASTRAKGGLLRWRGNIAMLGKSGRVPVLSATRFLVAGLQIARRVGEASPDLTVEQIAAALAAEPPLPDDPAFAAVRGRTVFVGANAAGTFDVKATPLGELEPGALIHWTAWSDLVANDFVVPLPRGWALVVAAAAMTAVIGSTVVRPGVSAPGIVAVGCVLVVAAAAYVGLTLGWFMPPATPVAATTLTLLGVAAESFWIERRRKREIQAMFGSYVAPEIVDLLVRDPKAIRLGGEKREATVFFSDLVGFTDLSEQVSPEQLLELINGYLQETSDCLLTHGAYIDKYIGDAVMAVFGAPQHQSDHALRACRAALAAQKILAERNTRLERSHGRRLGMRIGINTGDMIVGNLGSERKKNYTVLGDTVNLASRLEGANKEFGTRILLGVTTAARVRDELVVRPLTALRVKGKHTAVQVFELVGNHGDLSAAKRDFLDAYAEGHARYLSRRFPEAEQALRRAAALEPDDEMTRNLLQSAGALASSPPPDDWQPILTLKTK